MKRICNPSCVALRTVDESASSLNGLGEVDDEIVPVRAAGWIGEGAGQHFRISAARGSRGRPQRTGAWGRSHLCGRAARSWGRRSLRRVGTRPPPPPASPAWPTRSAGARRRPHPGWRRRSRPGPLAPAGLIPRPLPCDGLSRMPAEGVAGAEGSDLKPKLLGLRLQPALDFRGVVRRRKIRLLRGRRSCSLVLGMDEVRRSASRKARGGTSANRARRQHGGGGKLMNTLRYKGDSSGGLMGSGASNGLILQANPRSAAGAGAGPSPGVGNRRTDKARYLRATRVHRPSRRYGSTFPYRRQGQRPDKFPTPPHPRLCSSSADPPAG